MVVVEVHVEQLVSGSLGQHGRLGHVLAGHESVSGVDAHADVLASGLEGREQRVSHSGVEREVARLLGLVLEREAESGIFLGELRGVFAQPLPLPVVVGGEEVVVAVLGHPQVHYLAVHLQRAVAHLAQIVVGLLAYLRVAARDGPLAPLLGSEHVGDYGHAGLSVVGHEFLHRAYVVGAYIPGAYELDSLHIGNPDGSGQHLLCAGIVFVTFAETVAGVSEIT